MLLPHSSTLLCYFVPTGVTLFETTPFSLSSTVTGQEEDDDLLVCTISLSAPLAPTLAFVPIKYLITQAYSRCLNPPVSSLTPTVSSSDLV